MKILWKLSGVGNSEHYADLSVQYVGYINT